MKRLLFQTGIDTNVDDFISSCLVYQRNKPSRILILGELEPLLVPGRPQGSITLDLIMDLLLSKRLADFSYKKGGKRVIYNIILVIVYRLMKEGNFILVRKEIDLKQFIYIFLYYIFSKYRILDNIITDRVKLFTLVFQETFIKTLGIKRKTSIVFYPQIDNQIERINIVLESFLRIFIDFNQENQVDLLDLAEFV